jgi:hypothetical protein|tara:strand:- start:529 stop:777 length:249 start_codon:yes stop_codon:yes gene_type:complete
MSKKKSYMNNENILAEGFFSKLGKMLGLSSKEEKILKKNPKLKSALKDYNDGWKSLEKEIQDETGDKNFKFPHKKFTLSDFL